MKRALLLVIALGGIAGAAPLPAGIVTPPPGWTEPTAFLPMPSEPRLGTLSQSAYQAPGTTVVLVVARREVAVTDATRNDLATLALGEMDTLVSGTSIDESAKRANRHEQQLEAVLEWPDDSASTIHRSRTIVAATATTLVAVTGECVVPTSADGDTVQACHHALETLQVDLAGEVRVALAITGDPTATGTTAPTTTQLDAQRPASGSAVLAVPPLSQTLTLTAHDTMAPVDDRAHFGPIVVGPPPEPPADRRPFFVGAGILLFAILLYWNKQRRDRFEQEDGRPVRKPRAERRRNRDADADDLHAAAADPDASDPPEDASK